MSILRPLGLMIALMVGSCGGGGTNTPKDSLPAETQKLFSNITNDSNLEYLAGYKNSTALSEVQKFCGGIAAGDYDGDGLVDIFVVRGDIAHHLLYKNIGNNKFIEVSAVVGIDISNHQGCGPVFADINGDGRLDLFVGGIEGHRSYLLKNELDINGNIVFKDVTESYGLDSIAAKNTISTSFGDYDGDSWVDMFMGHWGAPGNVEKQHLWRNINGEYFQNTTTESGLGVLMVKSPTSNAYFGANADYSFSGTFADINNDKCMDLLVVSDFGTSQAFVNQCNGSFADATTSVIKDENGMGSAVGDIDNDGDLDWFVSAIFSFDSPGNRLYMNNSSNLPNTTEIFTDATESFGVEQGGWGWGACLADFNRDKYLDIFHVNGWSEALFNLDFSSDHSRLFLSHYEDNTAQLDYAEKSRESGIIGREQGRGVVCFDSDLDNDVDIIVVNGIHSDGLEPVKFFKNNSNDTNNSLTVHLSGKYPNTEAVGARIYLTTGSSQQMREISLGSNFISQNPTAQYFGIGQHKIVDEIKVMWPDGVISTLIGVDVNQRIEIAHPQR